MSSDHRKHHSIDPLGPGARAALVAQERPRRHLPIAPHAAPGQRGLPLAGEARTINRQVRPSYAVWELTLACDLACRHCGSRAGHPRPDELTTDECLDLVRQLAELEVLEVTLIGGEAYLREDWLEVARAIRAAGMQCTMTTGGRGLTRERLVAAKEAGIQSVSVSIDGDEETHDRLRGVRGSFRLAVQAMRHAHEVGISLACNTQINRLSMPHLPAILELLGELGARAWQYQLTVPMGRAADEPEVLVQPYDMLEVLPLLAQLKSRAKQLGILMWTGNNVGYFGPHEADLRAIGNRTYGGSCGAGIVGIGIEADGTIKGCPSLSTQDWAAGNVRDTKLVDIWERAARMRYTRDRTVADLWGFCASCYYADDCRAGCTWTSEVTFGRPGNNPFCHHRALELRARGIRERLVRVEEAPGMPFDKGRFELFEEAWPDHPNG